VRAAVAATVVCIRSVKRMKESKAVAVVVAAVRQDLFLEVVIIAVEVAVPAVVAMRHEVIPTR
jgi:hypothetical protein